MVRREEQPWESRATLVLDTRSAGHRGEGPTASFEWAVSAVASIAVHLRQQGYKLRMVTGGGIDVDAGEVDADGMLLDYLAEVRPDPRADIASLVDRVRHRTDGGLIIGVFGMLSPAEAELLGALRANNATCVGMLIDSSSWLHLPEAAREEADKQHAGTALALLRGGWRITSARHGDRLAGIWPQAAKGRQGFTTWRAAMAETVSPGGGGQR
jgi:hypothetical protein